MIVPTREDFPKLLNELQLTKRGVEIGVFKANFSLVLMKGVKFETFFGVDMWQPIPDYNGTRYQKPKSFWETIYNTAQKTMAPYKKNYQFLRYSSMQAAQQFSDEYFDFVYIDGDHRYDGIAQDINSWLPKVRTGGILAGHDYRNNDTCGVKRAVDEKFGDAIHLTTDGDNWFIFKKDN